MKALAERMGKPAGEAARQIVDEDPGTVAIMFMMNEDDVRIDEFAGY